MATGTTQSRSGQRNSHGAGEYIAELPEGDVPGHFGLAVICRGQYPRAAQAKMCVIGNLKTILTAITDEFIACLCGAESIQIFGSGEAKGELGARLEKERLKGRVVEVETVDKMTARQISAKVRENFQKLNKNSEILEISEFLFNRTTLF